jgi:hypothetical protein
VPPADDPERLLHDAAESVDLRSALDRMSRDLPDAAQMARLAARLGIAEPPPVDPSAGRFGAAKLAAGAGIVGIGALAVWLATRGETSGVTAPEANAPAPPVVEAATDSPSLRADAPRPRGSFRARGAGAEPASAPAAREPNAPAAPDPNAPPAGETARVASGSASRVEPGARREDGAAVRDGAASSVATSRANVTTGTSEGALPKAPSAPPPTETELLRDARLALDGNAAQALALSERHQREYPGGALTQEREVIAITALVRLGRSGDARARAERFVRVYPKSPYRQRIDALVAP